MSEPILKHLYISGLRIPVALYQNETKKYLSGFLHERPDCVPLSMEPVTIPMKEIQEQSGQYFDNLPFTEYNLMLNRFCNLLLSYHRCIFHGVAFEFEGRGWILSAPSGTGKSTQYRNWKKLYGDKVRLICGDKPVLEFQPSGDIIVHASPWRGKERWFGSGSAKLAGIIYLEQGKTNSIRRMTPQESVIPFYQQILYLPENTEQLHLAADMLEQLLTHVSLRKLVNLGDDASSILTHDTILSEKEES